MPQERRSSAMLRSGESCRQDERWRGGTMGRAGTPAASRRGGGARISCHRAIVRGGRTGKEPLLRLYTSRAPSGLVPNTHMQARIARSVPPVARAPPRAGDSSSSSVRSPSPSPRAPPPSGRRPRPAPLPVEGRRNAARAAVSCGSSRASASYGSSRSAGPVRLRACACVRQAKHDITTRVVCSVLRRPPT